MEKNLAGLIGAVSALGAVLPSHSASAMPAHNPLAVSSYADLLKPIPDALALLRASDAAEAARVRQPADEVLTVQYYHHHHHHHHHNFYEPRYYPPAYYPPRFYHHHHHHHHHHHWNRGERF